jgi:hypothetical protein
MLGPKFADAVTKRFAGKKTGAEGSAEEEGSEGAAEAASEGDSTDAEDGAMLASAIKNGDGMAICEAVRRIAGGG